MTWMFGRSVRKTLNPEGGGGGEGEERGGGGGGGGAYRPMREYNEAPTTDLTKASRPFCLPFKEQPQSQTPSGKSLLLVTQNL